jgi:hypothetical protein
MDKEGITPTSDMVTKSLFIYPSYSSGYQTPGIRRNRVFWRYSV